MSNQNNNTEKIKPQKGEVKLLSHVRLFAIPWTISYQAPPSMGFSRQEYWNGVPLPSPQPYVTTGKTIAVTIWTFVGRVKSLLFNTLYSFVIAFLPRSKHLQIS